ncbi:MAG TPA: DNA repair protein RadC [Nitrospiria bacterium]|nr:DNA repair protein RadC [Nitrospiria bacterium]
MGKKGITSWPENERPRERFILQGASSLTDAHLLAILIRTGKKGETALDLAYKLLNHFENLQGISRAGIPELSSIPGIGATKAVQLLSAFELGKRHLSSLKEKKEKILSSQDVFSQFQGAFTSLRTEVFRIALLNTRNQLIKVVEISQGSLNQTIVHPREVFSPAIRESAASIILLHNHPSGDPAPSPEDLLLTTKLIEAGHLIGIPVLDHLVFGAGNFFSFADHRVLDFSRTSKF